MYSKTLFVDILLPLPLPGYFTYRVPEELNTLVKPGVRVVVPFGNRKIYSGLIRRVHQTPPNDFIAKYISTVLDEKPIVFEKQFEFWEWIAEYYLSCPGDVMNVALPPALKLAGETRITMNPDFDGDHSPLNEKEYLIAEALEIQKTLSLSEVSKITGLQKVFPIIGNLMEKKVVMLIEELENPYRPRLEKFVRLSDEFESEEKLKEAFDYAESKAPRQLEVLVAFIKLSGRYQPTRKEVSLKEVSNSVKGSTGALQSLVQKGILYIYKKKISRFDHLQATAVKAEFNEYQKFAIDQIRSEWKVKDNVLLHGVTSSGKTEIYIDLIREELAKGKQVLYLLPEIALTTQIILRIQQHFGENAGVYHSRFNEMERTEVWNNLAFGGVESENKKICYQLVVGPRSALFLPFNNLGLIIVDEEHESSYKQHDPAPRYHARDAATWLARSFGAKVLLGSATPSVETYYHAKTGKYGLVEIMNRFGGLQMPEVFVADIKKETRQKIMRSHLTSLLSTSISEALKNQKQVILFQNRRGFSVRIECDQCNWFPMCTQCDVGLVYHKHINKLKCHYCGYAKTPPVKCPECASTGMALKGFGTEKIEEELPIIFPDAKIKRMDLDTTRVKNAYQRIIQDFEEKKIDILIGTQMVSKGLDFENVGVVGILSADNMLSFPDFRAHERAFQMMAQVSGRAGRKNTRGKVIIQALDPHHPVIRQVIENNYTEMYKTQILERRNFHYPPFYRLVTLTIIHSDPQLVNKGADCLASVLKKQFGKEAILGPEYPLVSRIKAQYLKNIIVKIDRKPNLQPIKEVLRKILDEFSLQAQWKGVRIKINVDPL